MASPISDRQRIREAIIAAFEDPDGTLALSPGQIIVADVKAPRPPMPYITIKVLTWNSDAGEAVDWHKHTLEGIDDDPATTTEGYREATVSLNAFGETAIIWIEDFVQDARHWRTTKEILRAAGITINYPQGPITDLSALVDTGFENRANRTLTVSYHRTGALQEHPELVKADVSVEFDSPSAPESLTMTGQIDPDNPPCPP